MVTVVIFVPVVLPSHAQQAESVNKSDGKEPITPTANKPALPLDEIKTFVEVFTQIKQEFIEPITDQELLKLAIEGVLSGLDPHSAYFTGKAASIINSGRTDRYKSYGLVLNSDGDRISVQSVLKSSTVRAVNIKVGDVVTEVDGVSTKGKSLQQVRDALSRKRNGPLKLKLQRESDEEPIIVAIERDVFQIESVIQSQLREDIGYLKISQFYTGTAEAFRKALFDMAKNPELSGLILDLRNNPGGLLNSAVAIADLFIDKGNIVVTRSRGKVRKTYTATASEMIAGKPIVVIIDDKTASAAEILAGALQDHKRALIIGTVSFGKGSVQTVLKLNKDKTLKLTTARYYTPNGRSIQAEGIVPDITVEKRKPYKPDKADDNAIVESKHKHSKPLTPQSTSLLGSDYQLQEAFNLIQGLVVFGGRS